MIAIPTVMGSTSTSFIEVLEELHAQASVLKEHLARAQNKMKTTADRKRRHQEFQEGEHVLLKLQPYAQTSLVNRPYPKLAFKYFGTYQVLEKVGRLHIS